MSLVETEWLEKNLDSVKIIDCSWHMPQTKRNGFDEYKKQHIPNAIFFDLDDNSKKNTDLPHMLIEINNWDKIVSKMGIKNDDKIIILPVFARLMGAESDKSKEMLKDSETKLSPSIEEAINKAVMEVNK